jgi:hypothetical protein
MNNPDTFEENLDLRPTQLIRLKKSRLSLSLFLVKFISLLLASNQSLNHLLLTPSPDLQTNKMNNVTQVLDLAKVHVVTNVSLE